MPNEKPVYQKTRMELFRDMKVSDAGLTSQEARQRQEQYGPNELQAGKRKSIPMIFLEQFKDLLVIILIVAAISPPSRRRGEHYCHLCGPDPERGAGHVPDVKAEDSLESLKELSAPTARVLRDGAGWRSPAVRSPWRRGGAGGRRHGGGRRADSGLLQLKVNESSLTGESEGVEKSRTPSPGGASGRPEEHGLFRSL